MKKIGALLIAFLFLLIAIFSPAPIQAAYLGPGSPSSPDSITGNTDPYLDSYTKSVYDNPTEFNQASYVNFANHYIISSGLELILGKNQLQALTTGAPISYNNSRDGGVIGLVSNLIATLYTVPPVSGINYLASVTSNLGFSTPVYAQTTGFKGLEPVLPIWTIVRNTAYLAFIVIFVVIGIMIMLRAKIDPRTVVSVQDAIPKIVISLILITFSYAIAGLLVDLTTLSMNLVVTIFEPLIKSGGAIDEVREAFTSPKKSIFNMLQPFIGDRGTGLIGSSVGLIIDNLFSGTRLGWLIGTFSGSLATLIILIVVVTSMFRIFFMLVTSYVTILVLTILAPLQFLLGAMPTQSGIGGWFKSMLVNILVFPATAFLLLLLAIFMQFPDSPYFIDANKFLTAPGAPGAWVAPLLGSGSDPVKAAQIIQALMGLGIILIMPSVKGMIQEALNYKGSQAASQLTAPIASAAGRIPIIGGAIGGVFR